MQVLDLDLALRSLPFVLGGLRYTLLIALVGMAIGMLLGLPIAIARMSQRSVFAVPATLYVSFMRGTPVLVVLFLLYFGLPSLGIELSAAWAAMLGFGVNSAGYIAEIDRAAIRSVPATQWETALSLGMTKTEMYRMVILPQAIRVAIPPLSNVMLDLLKASSLASVITVQEILLNAKIVAGRTFDSFTMYVTAAAVYWGVSVLFGLLQRKLERLAGTEQLMAQSRRRAWFTRGARQY
jgi:cystine transport system permease protein